MATVAGPGAPALRLGRIAGIPVRIDMSWFVVAAILTVVVAPTVDSWLPGLGNARYLVALAFALLLYGSVFVHELAHALTARRLGMQVRGITITLLGGVTHLEDDDPTPGRDAVVAAVGPLSSLLLGGAAWLAAQSVQDGLPGFLLLELAFTSLLVGVFNLLPTLPLDGGHLLKDAVWALAGRPGPGYAVAGWAGYLFAALLALSPWLLARPGQPSTFSVLWSLALAWFVFSGGRSAVRFARVSDRLGELSAAELCRPVTAVVAGTPVGDALARAGPEDVALVVVDNRGAPVAVAEEAAVRAVPEERRAHLDVRAVSRTVDPESHVPLSLRGMALVRRLQEAPAPAYVLVDDSGRLAGALLSRDVEATLAT